jgi:hypothetical protein
MTADKVFVYGNRSAVSFTKVTDEITIPTIPGIMLRE